MYALDVKRCPHCVGSLAALPLDRADGFEARGPAVVCHTCDDAPAGEQTRLAVFVPSAWE